MTNGFRGLRRVIDISGDGPNNRTAVVRARDAVLARSIVDQRTAADDPRRGGRAAGISTISTPITLHA